MCCLYRERRAGPADRSRVSAAAIARAASPKWRDSSLCDLRRSAPGVSRPAERVRLGDGGCGAGTAHPRTRARSPRRSTAACPPRSRSNCAGRPSARAASRAAGHACAALRLRPSTRRCCRHQRPLLGAQADLDWLLQRLRDRTVGADGAWRDGRHRQVHAGSGCAASTAAEGRSRGWRRRRRSARI